MGKDREGVCLSCTCLTLRSGRESETETGRYQSSDGICEWFSRSWGHEKF